MNIKKWLSKNTASLKGKTVAITGSTGGLGKELCRYLCTLGASLILVDRNYERSNALRASLTEEFSCDISCITTDLSDISSVKAATDKLILQKTDYLIHNAGAYDIPRYKTDTGYDNVFQINFISPYYMTKRLLPTLRERGGGVIAVGSIAHNYSKADKNDIDFSQRRASSKVYGNAKRYLMYGLHSLFKEEKLASLAVTHPGISFTGITNHYPKLIFAIIKHPMKIIFMKPRAACLSILKGVFEPSPYLYWTGPRFFDVWGAPKTKKLTTASKKEIDFIALESEKIYDSIK